MPPALLGQIRIESMRLVLQGGSVVTVRMRVPGGGPQGPYFGSWEEWDATTQQ